MILQGMQIMMYMFLRRNRQVDVPYINRSLSYLLHCATPRAALEPHASPGSSDLEPPSHVRTSGTPPSVYFFPEGTDLSPRNVERSNTCKWRTSYLPSPAYVAMSELLCHDMTHLTTHTFLILCVHMYSTLFSVLDLCEID